MVDEKYRVVVEEILAMAKADQDMRFRRTPVDPDMDRRHSERMKEIVTEFGWPTIQRFGKEASHMAWLLVQHADHDVEFQALCLKKIYWLRKGQFDPRNLALLEDRVRVNTGRPTLYGSQFYTDDNGVYGPRPIEKPEELDNRREVMGLGPFAEYEKEMRRIDKK